MATPVAMKLKSWWASGLTGLLISTSSLAASFPCEQAGTSVERTICKDQSLSELDEYLGRYYAAARLKSPLATECLASQQRLWLRKTRDACRDAACLRNAYLQRLGELHGLQPGASALKTVPLPQVPTLVGILPPARDQTAAPKETHLAPLRVTGQLKNELATGDGYVVLADNGQKVLLAALMFLDDSTSALEGLSKETSAQFVVSGSAAPQASSGPSFSQAACRYIYRAP